MGIETRKIDTSCVQFDRLLLLPDIILSASAVLRMRAA